MEISTPAAQLRDRLHGTLLAAAATPMTASGEVDLDVVTAYFRGLLDDGADGLAVLAHTGRGPFLPPPVRAAVIERAVALGVPVLVGIGGAPGAGAPHPVTLTADTARPAGPEAPADPVERAVAEARTAAELGAAGVLVFPSAQDRLAVHDAVWRGSGLPMIAFDLYTRPCPPALLREIVRHPGVAGLKTALLSDAMGCQEAIRITRDAGRLAITGEDRMFGPSLLWGAEAALVGIAAARVGVTRAVMRAFAGNELREFEQASARLDRLAAATFTAPMEGYVQRMLWLAAAEGRIPHTHAVDLFGPAAGEDGRALERSVLAEA
ncbi:dihydrodipicolinate synthase family protein [Rhizohabitans arisaemae]|uniref:dihydrodipicolinate synthase family protein n=1 Tax=Rhizohabitans arisaemae TaxID=2720610 RepID=UPI0024B26687|nr:dihydrodipicolinate synthase family protein [Rhizohabitans arisaemae]